MKFNTGRASYQISAGSKASFAAAHNKDKPTAAQKKYWRFLVCRLHENGFNLGDVGEIPHKLEKRQDYKQAIYRCVKFLVDKKIIKPNPNSYKAKKEEHAARRREEIKNTKWISFKSKKPDRKYVKTIDNEGNIYTLEWNGKCFIDEWGRPCTAEYEKTHKYKEPIAWAYLE